ncbi:septum formation inhibitor Maf [Methylomonas sp. LL1]|uniref:Maf family protein n=1 Tax=Methylomonas sp. LL1 TaxID=2785785 RepID=UPI0018C3C277|nr:nucleoside triphosphate pyrophosphatase [Methylomonas sp. LL1]QPK61716.1 septum formation inhibitor Maf [Methylomonas sp. LL1]
MQTLVLASSSTYRHDLLKKLQLDFIACSSAIDETPLAGESAHALALRLSIAKAQAIADKFPNHLIIGSDQVACHGDMLLGKPGNREKAFQQLKAQSGRIIRFYTGLCLLNSANNACLTDIDVCNVHFRQLSDRQIQRYLTIEQPFDCAGSFKSEGYGIVLFNKIETEDPNALVGLPLIKLVGLLAQCGLAIP